MGREEGAPYALQALQPHHVGVVGTQTLIQNELVAGNGFGLVHENLCALQFVAHEQEAVSAVQVGQRAVGVGGDVDQFNGTAAQINDISVADDLALVVGIGQLRDVKGQAVTGVDVPLTAGQHHHRLPLAVAAGMIQMTMGVGDQNGLGGELLHKGTEVARAPAGVDQKCFFLALQQVHKLRAAHKADHVGIFIEFPAHIGAKDLNGIGFHGLISFR